MSDDMLIDTLRAELAAGRVVPFLGPVKLPRLRRQFSAWVRRAGVIPPFVVVG